MKTTILIILTFFTVHTFAAPATKFGIGALLGDPTALSVKSFLNQTTAVDGGVGYGKHEVILFGDYLRHFPGRLGRQNGFIAALSPYVGVGPVFAFGTKDKSHSMIEDDEDTFAFGGRIPFGIEWMSQEIPLGVSLELVPGLVVIPETNALFQGGLALRYYF